MLIPAQLTPDVLDRILLYAKEVYHLCDCKGFARLDFFLSGDQLYFNEINTLPGFTVSSMFPRLMQTRGLSYTQLISTILELADQKNSRGIGGRS